MIQFRQKQFSEYDAMRSLYVELMKRCREDRRSFPVINMSSMIPILKGNNIVIEKFVISTSMFGKDKYRMYIKIGAKAKLPDEVRLPGRYYDKRLLDMSVYVNGAVFGKNNQPQPQQRNNSEIGEVSQKMFKGGGGNKPIISTEIKPSIEIRKEVQTLLGEAIKYDKTSRSLVLEFDSIQDAINALNILPFGIDYKIYLLNA